ncbi:tRNA (guanosine(46)-N7)-methyltransferase TrmB [Lederbergia galactosidilytica]|uniref:tRNA (guanine-N(7)-)-methyltransferase n=1 Tax=Lederbergia galactosidilytica TaxID=217031 RepID=A0A177ZLD2_9BACI|nr:tRNA (guanosine(46)-N7)-methyltransferase TrmB [Lederbergia galactosidilytica]KRG16065.1 tRNA (guanine-N7)-methyltransferase [Virgibacillus soli]MBP1915291.1 tRNA (guanine-N7-)-methyltransferase [Lederbergia galactosidilytica]OAK68120.1 tRNA (guanine-N7)-methyltransferase [Lederbergia galactosidilytica]
MRVRHKPWAKEKIEQYPQFVIPNPQDYKGKWTDLFGNDKPLHIEVGTGKGQFISEMARVHPDINYIGIELQQSVIVTALDKVIEADVPNVKLLHTDGADLRNFFSQGDVARVYLNFSDPWPKNRHEKRRLTHHSFLKIYEEILGDQGEIHFKTDNRGLFEYSLVSFSHYGMKLNGVWLDLHDSDYEGNIMTEYEEKFTAKGHPIYRCEVQFTDKEQKRKRLFSDVQI